MALSDIGSNLSSMAKSVAGNIDKATITLGGYQSVGDLLMLDAQNAIRFELPFNPSSIRIDVMAGGGHKISSSDGINYGTIDPRIMISFTAYVDEVNIYDAFLYERVNNGSSIGLARTAINMTNTEEYSVAVYVEGLLAALRSEGNSQIEFTWGSMDYVGTLNTIDAKYTMFNPMGTPIKAEIEFRILCITSKKQALKEEWRTKFEDAMEILTKEEMSEDGEKKSSIDLANVSAIGRFVSF